MGGRGASSDYGKEGTNTGGDNKPLPFYDKSNVYRGMTVQEFEKKIRNRKVEYVGLYDDSGKIIIAGTSGRKGAVAIPTTHPDFSKINSLTHNHPNEGGRQLGGSFSGADVSNHIKLGLKNTRATANEKTYIIKESNPTKSQSTKLLNRAIKSDDVWSKNAKKAIAKIEKQFKANGKVMTSKIRNQIMYGYGTKLWKGLTNKSGYDYIEIKDKNR